MIEGFEREPLIREPWNPPYYSDSLRRGRADQGDGPVRVGSVDQRPRADEPDAAEGRRARTHQVRDHDPPDVTTSSAPRDGRVRQGLQRGLVSQLGLRPILEGRPRPVHDRHATGLLARLVHDRRGRRQDGRDGDHDPRHPPGLQEDERPVAAARLALLPDARAGSSTDSGSASSACCPSTSTPASRPPCTSSTSRPPSTAARRPARRASSSRSTRR